MFLWICICIVLSVRVSWFIVPSFMKLMNEALKVVSYNNYICLFLLNIWNSQLILFGKLMQIPFCVVTGWIMGQPMDLNFKLFETVTLFITVIVVAFLLQVRNRNPLFPSWKIKIFTSHFIIIKDETLFIIHVKVTFFCRKELQITSRDWCLSFVIW